MKRLLASLLGLALCATAAIAQVRQSGTVTQRHAACWTTSGVIQDCGTAAIPFASSFGTVGQGPTICANSAASTGAYNQLCFGANTSSNAIISLQNFGGASAQGIDFVINGIVSSLLTGTGPFNVNGVPCFSNTAGNLIDCGLKALSGAITQGAWQGTPVAILYGGTGATTSSAARTNLGLGTMAVQNAGAVAITGGAIGGMPNPSVGGDVANKSYVDSIGGGKTPLPQARLATATVLPNSPVYANGTLGVGATLTAGSNAALSIDSVAVATGNVVLVENQVTKANNGLYTVTQTGDGSNPYILTRSTAFDQAAEMVAGATTLVTAGSVNAGKSFSLLTAVATVGTNEVNFTQTGANSNLADGDVRVWPVLNSIPNAVGNLQAVDAYGTTIDCSALSPGDCIQAAYDIAYPASGNIFVQDNARSLKVQLGYGADNTEASFTLRGYQNIYAVFTGLGFYKPTFKSCEMCDISFPGAQSSTTPSGWTFTPNDIGAPGGDHLCQIVDSRYFGTTVFSVTIDITQTSGACPTGGGVSNSKIEIIEFNTSNPALTCGLTLFSPRAAQNYGHVTFTAQHTHKDQVSGLSTYYCVGDGAPAVGQTFGYNTWNLNIDNTASNGSETGFSTWASKDTINLTVSGFTTGQTIFFHSGACGNVAYITTDQAIGSVNITDNGGCAAGAGNTWFINGTPFVSGSRGFNNTCATGNIAVKNGYVTGCL